MVILLVIRVCVAGFDNTDEDGIFEYAEAVLGTTLILHSISRKLLPTNWNHAVFLNFHVI